MQEFSRRGVGEARELILHGCVAEVTDGGCCDRCNHSLKSAYLVSHRGGQATHRICPRCWKLLAVAYGLTGEEGKCP